jgi:hypothetical protein
MTARGGPGGSESLGSGCEGDDSAVIPESLGVSRLAFCSLTSLRVVADVGEVVPNLNERDQDQEKQHVRDGQALPEPANET